MFERRPINERTAHVMLRKVHPEARVPSEAVDGDVVHAQTLIVSPGQVLRVSLLLTGSLTLLSLLFTWGAFAYPQLFEHVVLRKAYGAVHLDYENNVPSFVACLGLLASSVAMLVSAVLSRASDLRASRWWCALGALFVLLAFDEANSLHEKLIEPLLFFRDISGFFEYSWVSVGAVFAFVIACVFFRFWWRLPPVTRSLIGLAGSLHVGGAVGAEMIGGNYSSIHGYDSLGYKMIMTAEESMEMLGVSVLIYAVLNNLQNICQHFEVRVRSDS